MSKKGYERILVMSDTHAPYCHPDTVAFYKAIKKEYDPDYVVHIGDEVDFHAISFHDHDPDLMGANHELNEAIKVMTQLYYIFPRVSVIDSNHGSLVYRRAKHAGLPRTMVKSYNEVLHAPSTWTWTSDLTLRMSDGSLVYFHHGKTSARGALSKNMAMSTVQGHYHSQFSIEYWGNPNGLFWDMRVGCTINDKSLAFEYNKTTLHRPIIGCGIIIKGQPMLIPMVLKEDGRWIGELL